MWASHDIVHRLALKTFIQYNNHNFEKLLLKNPHIWLFMFEQDSRIQYCYDECGHNNIAMVIQMAKYFALSVSLSWESELAPLMLISRVFMHSTGNWVWTNLSKWGPYNALLISCPNQPIICFKFIQVIIFSVLFWVWMIHIHVHKMWKRFNNIVSQCLRYSTYLTKITKIISHCHNNICLYHTVCILNWLIGSVQVACSRVHHPA